MIVMVKPLARLLVVLLLAFAVAPATAQQETIDIPVLLPLTGTAAFMGGAQSTALLLMEQYLNSHGGIRGHSLHFTIQDDQSNPANAVQLVNGLIARQVPAFIGPAFTSECLAVAPLLKDGPVGYCTSPGIRPATGSYVYSAGLSAPDLAALLIRYFHGRGWNRVATISSTDASGQAFDAAVDRALASPEFHSITLVGREHFNVADLNVEAQLARIKSDSPQAVIEWTAGAAFATLLRGTRDVDLDVPIAGGNANMQFKQLQSYSSFIPRELLFPTTSSTTIGGAGPGPIHDVQQTYFDIFRHAGMVPDAQNNTIWDPAMLIVSAYRTIGPTATAKQIQDYLQKLHSWTGTNGIYDFRDGSQRGIGIGVGVVARWDPAHQAFTSVSRLGGAPK